MRFILLVLLIGLSSPAAWAGAHAGKAEGNKEVADTASVHADDKPVASPGVQKPPRMPVTGETVVYGRIGDTELSGYLAKPEGATDSTPGLIVIHEWWGLNDNIRKAAERLAGEGYVALAVDLYGGQSASIPKDAIKLMNGLMADQDSADENIRQAHRYLEAELGAPKVGSIGWCLGGRWSLRTATLLPDQLDAAVIYYGSVKVDEADLAPLGMPVLGNFAEDDPLIPLDSVEQFTSTMQRLGKTIDVKVYPDTQHAFSNPSGLAYNEAAAEDAWKRSTGFLRTHLQAEK